MRNETDNLTFEAGDVNTLKSDLWFC